MKNKLRNQKKFILIVCSFALFSVGCAPYKNSSVEQASQSLTESLGCANLQSKVFDSFYDLLSADQSIPKAGDLKQSLQKKLQQLKTENHFSNTESEKLDQISEHLSEVVDLMLSEAAKNPKITWNEQVQKLIEYEMGDQSSKEIIQTTQKVEATLKQVHALAADLPVSCANPEPVNSTATKAVSSTILGKGLNMVFATAYQSCRVLELPPMDRTTPDVDGIKRTGTTSNGIGGIRIIDNLKNVQNTHYYLRGLASESSCADMRSSPLIYDYGGKVATSGNTLSFFKNAGSGSAALGVDCSGYVAAGIAVAGLRYKPGVAAKPIYQNMQAVKYVNAQSSGFSCFDNVTVTPTASIKVGDIVGVDGHVVAIDKLGADPFALSLIKTEAGCSSLNYKNFDIVVTQSSPSKNGIGMNKYVVRDYLPESGKMMTAFVQMGQQACLSKFQNKNIKPASNAWGFVRHKGTAECTAPRAVIEGEACTQSCLQ